MEHPVTPELIEQAHQLYVQLTGQKLPLNFYRERLWFELLRQGHSLEELRHLITYLQKEVRAQRRNVGALKLSNLLQPDRFEEDLQISRVRLKPPPRYSPRPKPKPPDLSPAEQTRRQQQALDYLRDLKNNLG